MIHVAITCRNSSPSTGRICPQIEDEIPAEETAGWYTAALAEHAWTVDADGNTYCPRHNPADIGAPVTLNSEQYLPLGDSGWEARARMPEDARFDVAFASIEIRQQHGDDDA